MKYCPKWYCGGEMKATTVRTVNLRGLPVLVRTKRCPNCGYEYEDYDMPNDLVEVPPVRHLTLHEIFAQMDERRAERTGKA